MNRIALLRKNRKMSQKELGTVVGVAQNTVCNWENGNREPDHEALKKMAVFFDCSIDYLLGQEETEEEPIPVAGDGLSESEWDLINIFRRIPPDEQERVIRIVQAASDSLRQHPVPPGEER